jgi:hypothetical protein
MEDFRIRTDLLGTAEVDLATLYPLATISSSIPKKSFVTLKLGE